MIFYPKLGSYIRDKVKILLDVSNYATKEELGNATDVDTANLVVKNDFIALKAKSGKLDINKLTNVPTGLNNLKTTIVDLGVEKLRKEVVKK